MSTETPAAEPRPFTQWLLEQRAGQLHAELSAGLRELTAACVEHGAAGQLTLTIKVKPHKAAAGSPTLFVADQVVVKAPQGERGAAIFFADEAGNLRRDDPRQPQLPLQEVPRREPRDIKEAGS